MKKTLVFIALMLITTLFISAKNFRFTVYCDYFSAADTTYKEEYGGRKFFPEAKLSFRVKGHFYLWGSGGFLPASYKWDEWSNKGVVNPDIEGKNASRKFFLSGGLGYWVGYFDKSELALKLELGACSTGTTVKITTDNTASNQNIRSEKNTEWGIGVRGNLGVTYGLLKSVFAEASIGYLYVWNKRDEEYINDGGLRLAIGLGVKF
jgi:hypothetical protein